MSMMKDIRNIFQTWWLFEKMCFVVLFWSSLSCPFFSTFFLETMLKRIQAVVRSLKHVWIQWYTFNVNAQQVVSLSSETHLSSFANSAPLCGHDSLLLMEIIKSILDCSFSLHISLLYYEKHHILKNHICFHQFW